MRPVAAAKLERPNDRTERFETGLGTLGMGGSSIFIGNTLLSSLVSYQCDFSEDDSCCYLPTTL